MLRRIAVLAMCVGCLRRDDGRASLDEWSDLQLSIQVGIDHAVVLELRHSVVHGDAQCQRIDTTVTATIDGRHMGLQELGHRNDKQTRAITGRECAFPRFVMLTEETLDGAMLELADETRTIRCELPDLRSARVATLAGAELRIGQPFDVAWSPESDLRLFSLFTWLRSKETGVGTAPIDRTVSPEHLTYEIPKIESGLWELTIKAHIPRANCGDVPNVVMSAFTSFQATREVTIVR